MGMAVGVSKYLPTKRAMKLRKISTSLLSVEGEGRGQEGMQFLQKKNLNLKC